MTRRVGSVPAAPACAADGGVPPHPCEVGAGALPDGPRLAANAGVVAGTVKEGRKVPATGPCTCAVTATDRTRMVPSCLNRDKSP